MSDAHSIEISVNGNASACFAGCALEKYLVDNGLAPDRVVVEKNGVIVPVAEYAHTSLDAGDILELIHFVGGG